MGPSCRLFLCFLLCGGTELCCPQLLPLLPVGTPTPMRSTSPVEVECLEADLVVTVRKDLFGTGKLVQFRDLTLGSDRCRPLVSMDTDVVRFKAPLHECSSRVQGNVSSHAVWPTWVPFSTTVSSEEKLAFSLRLMEENWSAEKSSPTFHLGEVAHLQAEVQTGSHPPLQLFVDHCVATPWPDQTASPYHVIVDSHGCLVDGLSESFSAFQAPRPRPETLQFTVDVFHFANSSRNTTPDKLNKACSFNRTSKSWLPVEGDVGICDCCKKGNCSSLNNSRHSGAKQWPQSASRNRRHGMSRA
ncbi:hypothetical protein A6R68_02904 [Neotoma lepida]|uniref:Zona pellucida sperm-binding protein 3 n=1 Tax=Neotoma lepida TaxID=56216 RepID=A0A1A6GQT4_NEOLE|nr:hypothetical protein A6R68_02904 [Neotoma lepida]